MTAADLRTQSPAGAATFQGRTKVSPAALNSVARAVIANALGVPAKLVSVQLSDNGGGLGLRAKTPVAFADDKTDQLSWLHSRRSLIADRVSDQTGAQVNSVTLDITGTANVPVRRVK